MINPERRGLGMAGEDQFRPQHREIVESERTSIAEMASPAGSREAKSVGLIGYRGRSPTVSQ